MLILEKYCLYIRNTDNDKANFFWPMLTKCKNPNIGVKLSADIVQDTANTLTQHGFTTRKVNV